VQTIFVRRMCFPSALNYFCRQL